jgi:8-oxo-dGTP diphosphatase
MMANDPRHTVVVSCLVRNANGEVLLVRHHKRGWEIPQGRVEEGESLLDALHREVREETGVEIEPGPLAAVWSKLSTPPAVIFTFVAGYTSGELLASDECPEVGWFAGDEALALVTHPVNRDRLRVLLDFAGAIIYRSYLAKPYQVVAETRFGDCAKK